MRRKKDMGKKRERKKKKTAYAAIRPAPKQAAGSGEVPVSPGNSNPSTSTPPTSLKILDPGIGDSHALMCCRHPAYEIASAQGNTLRQRRKKQGREREKKERKKPFSFGNIPPR